MREKRSERRWPSLASLNDEPTTSLPLAYANVDLPLVRTPVACARLRERRVSVAEIAIHIQADNRLTQATSSTASELNDVDGSADTARPSAVDANAALIRKGAVPARRTNEQVGEAVEVEVATSQCSSELSGCGCGPKSLIRRRVWCAGQRAVEDVDTTVVESAELIARRRADCEVGGAVLVDVPDASNDAGSTAGLSSGEIPRRHGQCGTRL